MASDQSDTVSDFGKVALPIFVVSMIAENWYLKQQPQRTFGDLDNFSPTELSSNLLPGDPLVPVGYERQDTQASLTALVGSVAAGLTTIVVTHKLDTWLYRHRIFNLGKRKGAFIGAMVAWDFLYYWEHRWMHEMRIFWAHHVTHHSSQHYNLSTALRQSWTGAIMHWVFVPMPLLGFPPAMTLRASEYNLFYQFWIHTEAIDRLPASVEAVLNTPSHHRVHHGANPQYLDRNYGGILVTWDKIFGTFEPELRRVKYGLTKNIQTFNPLRIEGHEFIATARDVLKAKGWKNKVGHLFRGPGWKSISPQ